MLAVERINKSITLQLNHPVRAALVVAKIKAEYAATSRI